MPAASSIAPARPRLVSGLVALLAAFVVLVLPGSARAATVAVSGTALQDEVTSVAWARCDGTTANVAILVDGASKVNATCNATTGAFTANVNLASAGQLLTVFTDTNSAAAHAATYVRNANTTSPITGLRLVQRRVWIASVGGGTISEGSFSVASQSLDSDIPLSYAAGPPPAVSTDPGVGIVVGAGATLATCSSLNTTSMHVSSSGTYTNGCSDVRFTGSGEGGCTGGPGVARPLCVDPGGSWSNSWQLTLFAFDRDIEVETAATYGWLVFGGTQKGATAHLGTALGQTLSTQSWMSVGSWFTPEPVTVDTTRWHPNIAVGKNLFVGAFSTLRGDSPETISAPAGINGGGQVLLPAADVTVAADRPYVELGTRWWGNEGSFVLGSLTVTNAYTRTPWATAGTGITPAYNSAGTNTDVPARVRITDNGFITVGNQPTNGGDWFVQRVDWDGNLATGFAGTGRTTWNSGGTNADVAYDAASGWIANRSVDYVVGQRGTNSGDWAIRAYDDVTGVPVASFGTSGMVTYNSAAGTSIDAARAVRVADGYLWVAGTVGSASTGQDWAVQQYDATTGALLNTLPWGGAGTDTLNWMVADQGSLYVGGSTGSAGGDIAVRKVNGTSTPTPTWDTSFSGGGTYTWDSGTSTVDTSTSGVMCDVDANLCIAGTSSTNGGDMVVQRLSNDGYLQAATTYDSGAGADNAWGIEAIGPSITVVGDVPSNGGDVALLRFGAMDLAPDTTWGTAGRVTWNSGGTQLDSARDLYLESDNEGGDGSMIVAVRQGTNGGDVTNMLFDYDGALMNTTTSATTVRVNLGHGAAPLVVSGKLVVGRAGDPGTTTFDDRISQRAMRVGGDMTVTSTGRVRAPKDVPWTLAGDLTVNGTFLHDNGKLTLTDPSSRTDIGGTSALTLNDLSIAPGKLVRFPTATTTTVAGALTAVGSSCTNQVQLASTSPGTRANLNVTGSASVQYAVITDSNAVTARTATNTVNGGNNAGWTISGACANGAGAPTNLFTADGSSQTSATHGVTTTTTPHFSWVNRASVGITQYQEQVFNDTLDDVAGLWNFNGAGTDTVAGGIGTAVATAPATFTGSGRFGSALSLPGTGGYATIPSRPLTTYTVDLWTKITACDGDTNPAHATQPLIAKSAVPASSDRNYSITVDCTGSDKGSVTAGFDDGGWFETVTSSGGELADGGWHYVAFAVDSDGKGKLYIDGNIVQGSAEGGTPVTSSASTWVGRDVTGTGQQLAGLVDELRISGVARSGDAIRGYYHTMLPHFTTLWDSGGAGTTWSGTPTCNAGQRCPDVVYGGSTGDLLRSDARYYTRARFNGGVWSTADWFETVPAITVAVSLPTASLGRVLSGTDSTAQSSATVSTNNISGYSLLLREAGPVDDGLQVLPSFPSPDSNTPAPWAPLAGSGFGVTVLSAPGRSAARWGTGTVATDVGNLKYVGPATTNPTTLASTTAANATPDTITWSYRANPPPNQPPGRYASTLIITAVANP
ncbi:MAG: hypothetical protein JWM98_3353 [Thermoleophilia bacterium]|nr:hypothetical protein [Thermoleophilia bacterium]